MPASPRRCRLGSSPTLFADAKAAEDAIEQVVGVDGADDGAEIVERQPKLQGEQLRRLLMQCHGVALAEMLQACGDMVPAAAEARRQRTGAEFLCRGA